MTPSQLFAAERKKSPLLKGSLLCVVALLVGYFLIGWGGAKNDQQWKDVQTGTDLPAEVKSTDSATTTSATPQDASEQASKLPTSQSGETTFNIEVVFSGKIEKTGQIVAGIFDNASNFKRRSGPIQSAFLKLSASDEFVWEFVDLPPGTYAISAYHDANENSTLDKGAFGVPQELYGFSNNTRGKFGPPNFSQCTFDLNSSTSLQIELR